MLNRLYLTILCSFQFTKALSSTAIWPEVCIKKRRFQVIFKKEACTRCREHHHPQLRIQFEVESEGADKTEMTFLLEGCNKVCLTSRPSDILLTEFGKLVPYLFLVGVNKTKIQRNRIASSAGINPGRPGGTGEEKGSFFAPSLFPPQFLLVWFELN